MRILPSLLVLSLAGCPGQAPGDPQNTPDGGDVADGSPTSFMLSGKAIDYFGMIAVGDATVTTDGLTPARMATSATDGAYQLDVAVGSVLFLIASKTNYRATRNQSITVGDTPVVQDVFVTSLQDVRNQYTAIGATPVAGTAFVVADIRRNNNTPLEGIPNSNVQLLTTQNQPVPGVKGPYFFNASGSLDVTQTTLMAYSGRSRAAFLDVPPGTYTLAVSYQNNMGATMTQNTQLSTVADGTTLVQSGGGMGGGGSSVTDPSFAMHIYPKLQRAALGGLGCANCHTLTGPAAFLKFDDPAATVLTAMTARPGVINLTTPADSFVLKRPLYEPPPLVQDHPNATFIDTNDADYKLFLLWITNGAKP
jgi:hypothetical protein